MRIIGTIVGVVVVLALSACGGGDGAPSAEATADGTVIPAAVVEAMAVSQGEFFIGLSVDGQAEEKIEPTLNADRTRFSFTRELQAGNHRFAINYYLRTPDPASPGEVRDIAVEHYESSGDFVLLAGAEESLDMGSARMPLTMPRPDDDEDDASNLAELTEGVYFFSNNADLSALGIEGDTGLVEPFKADRLSYTARLPSTQTSVAVTAAVREAGATFKTFIEETIEEKEVRREVSVGSIPIIPGDNTVIVTVTSEDGHTENTYAMTVNRNRPPGFKGDGNISLAENTTTVDIAAEDPDGDVLTLRATGGADKKAFSTDPTSGALVFRSAPDFEGQGDADKDNIYEVVVEVDDGRGEVDQKTMIVAVTNVNQLQLQVSYPPAGGNVVGKNPASTVTTVTGNIIDIEDGIVTLKDVNSLTVNGIETIREQDTPARWSVQVPVLFPTDQLVVSVESSSGHVHSVEQSVFNQAILVDPVAITIDRDGKRALVIDSALQAVIEVNLADGSRRVFSDADHGKGPGFGIASGITVDAANDRALVTQWDPVFDLSGDVIEVDLATRNRRIFTQRVTDPFLILPTDITVDAANERALVIDASNETVFELNLADETSPPLWESTPGGPGTTFPDQTLTGITVDAVHERALVISDTLDAVIEVALADGSPRLFSDAVNASGPDFDEPSGITLDAAKNRALVIDMGLDAVIAVALSDGSREVISGAGSGSGPDFDEPRGIAMDVDAEKERALVADNGLRAIIEVDLASKDRSRLFSEEVNGLGPNLKAPAGITLDAANNRALVVDDDRDAVLAVDLSSGNRTIISDGVSGNGPGFNFLTDITLDAANNRALVTDNRFGDLSAVIAVDLREGETRGDRWEFSGPTNGSGSKFLRPTGITVDEANNRALVTDEGLGAVIAVDLREGETKGDREEFSGPMNGDGAAFESPAGITLDAANNRALVVDSTDIHVPVADFSVSLDAVIAVDLADGRTRGNRTIISEAENSGLDLADLSSITLDAANNRALVIDRRLDAVIAVDLREGQTRGDRSVLSDAEKGSGPALSGLTGIIMDAANNVALVVERNQGLVLAIEGDTGERAVLSK